MNTAAMRSERVNQRRTAAAEALPLILAALFFVALTVFPSVSGGAVSKALVTCAERLIPSLFPFMVASELLLRFGFAEAVGALIGKPFEKLFGISGQGAAAFVIGSLCGLPLGARYAVSLYKSGGISRSECERLTAISNNAGIGFTVIGVGYGIWGSYAFGWLLYLCQIAASIIVGATIFRGKATQTNAPVTRKYEKKPFPITLCEAVSASASGMLSVCAFAIFFSTASALARKLCAAISLPELFGATLSALFELATACEHLYSFALSSAHVNANCAVVLTFFAIGFSGLCVHAQTLSSCLGSGVQLKKYMLIKVTTGIVCAFTGAIVLYLFV